VASNSHCSIRWTPDAGLLASILAPNEPGRYAPSIDWPTIQDPEMTDFAAARRKMVDNQLRTTGTTDRRLLAAIGTVPREAFVPEERRAVAYSDMVQPLGGGRGLATPADFAKLAQLAEIRHSDRVLDVGPGTGYSTAVFSLVAAEVVALEADAGLAAEARHILADLGYGNVRVVQAASDGSARLEGLFDAILIEGVLDAEPTAFFGALADGGRLVALVRKAGSAPVAHIYVRSGDEVAGRTEFNAHLPPLDTAPRSETFVF